MLEAIDWGEVPDSDRVPNDAYHLTVKEAVKEFSDNGIALFHATLEVDAPELYKGTTLHPRFYVGTDDDPDADLPETWKKFGGQQAKKFCIAVFGDVAQLTGNPYNDFVGCQGYPVGCIVELRQDNRKTRKTRDGQTEDNPYYGQEQQRFTKWFSVLDPNGPKPGTLAVRGAPGRPAAPTPPVRPPAAPPVAAVPPQPPAPVAAQTPAPAAPARPAPARVAPPAPAGRPAPGRPAPPPPRAA